MRRARAVARTVWLETIRRKDIYVLAILLVALLCALLSADVFGLGATTRYVTDLGLMAAWLFSLVLAVGVGCRQLPEEERRGTVYFLLSKPVTRGELLAGKWMGAWGVVAFATAAFYLLVAGVAAARGGALDPAALAQAWLLHAAALAWVVALGIALSTRMTFGAAAASTAVLLAASFTIVPRVPEIIGGGGADEAALLVLYYLFPHLELFDMRMRLVHEWGTVPWGVGALLVAYGAVLAVLFMALARLGYRRKRFSRGEIG
ncbi:MAG: ABC transporter permease subunit [bacterium]|nr:ABC transporter permease subunit [bacterium]